MSTSYKAILASVFAVLVAVFAMYVYRSRHQVPSNADAGTVTTGDTTGTTTADRSTTTTTPTPAPARPATTAATPSATPAAHAPTTATPATPADRLNQSLDERQRNARESIELARTESGLLTFAPDIRETPSTTTTPATTTRPGTTPATTPGIIPGTTPGTVPGVTTTPAPSTARTTPPVARTAPAVPRSMTHTLAKGETLSSIALAFYGDADKWRDIAKANPGLNPNRIKTGQVIRLPKLEDVGINPATPARVSPAAVNPPPPPSAAEREARFKAVRDAVAGPVPRQASVTVTRGDTLTEIARQVYGSGHLWPVIYSANRSRMANPSDLRVGMTLTVPRKPVE